MMREGLEQGLAKLPHLRDSSELYTTIGFSIGEEIVYETKIYRKCSVICNKRNCFTWTALRETTSNIPLSVTHFSEWFLCYTPVVVSRLLLLPFLSFTHFSEWFLCYSSVLVLLSRLIFFCLLLTFLNIFFVMNCKIIEDETITQTYYLWKLMIDWCSLSNRVFLQGKEFTRRNWLWEPMIFHS